MDMMALRRMVMAQMASGAQFVKGTITTDNSSFYTLNFGKTISKYLFLIEMTETSKATLLSSGISNTKMYSCFGTYPIPSIGNYNGTTAMLSERITASTGSTGSAAAGISGITDSSITLVNAAISNTSFPNAFIQGYSYNYYIVEIK